MSQAGVRIKFCGLTRREDVEAAARLGVDYIGFNFHPLSPRFVGHLAPESLTSAVPARVLKVGIFVSRPPEEVRSIAEAWSLDLVQLHGPDLSGNLADYGLPVIRALAVRDEASLDGLEVSRPAFFLLDSYHESLAGGTGQTFDWRLARVAVQRSRAPIFVAGGLTPDNVAEAVRQVRPFAVDVAGGIEEAPGVKSEEKMRRFVAAVRGE
ncbi:phosphoribosylanthranilate isomerase [bacterium]|nr:phosphoribosylanthranilate isomerase [bacterium]